MSASFVTKINNYNKLTKIRCLSEAKVTVQPQKVYFREPKSEDNYVSKVVLTNQTLKQVEFRVQQPKKANVRVRMRKNVLQPTQSLDLFVVFMIHETTVIEDQFCIYLSNQSVIHVPIIIKMKDKYTKLNQGKKTVDFSEEGSKKKINKFRTSKKEKTFEKRSAKFIQNPTSNKKIEQYIKDFILKFNKIEESLRDKSISNESFIGEKPLSIEKYIVFEEFNSKLVLLTCEKQKKKISTRFKTEICEEGPVICQLGGTYPKYPRWNISRNIPKITYNKGMRKLQEQVRKLVVNYRFEKINKIRKIYKRFQEEEQMNKYTDKMIKKKMNSFQIVSLQYHELRKSQSVDEDEVSGENQIEKARKHQFFCRKISHILETKIQNKSSFEFNKFTLSPKFLEIDHMDGREGRFHEFQIEARIGFDNWVVLDEVAKSSHEIMGYTKKQNFYEWNSYVKCSSIVESRNGCEIQFLRNFNKTSQNKVFFKLPKNQPYFEQFSDDSFKIYKELDLFEEQFLFPEEDGVKNLINYENSSVIKLIQYFRQQFFPQHTLTNFSLLDRLVGKVQSKIISKIDRQDRLTIEKIIQSESFYSLRQTSNIKMLLSENEEQISFRQKQPTEVEEDLQNKILQNLKKIQIREMDQVDVHVASYNKFTVNPANMIYF